MSTIGNACELNLIFVDQGGNQMHVLTDKSYTWHAEKSKNAEDQFIESHRAVKQTMDQPP